MSRAEQDKIFKRNAHIRQKLWGAGFALLMASAWAVLLSMDEVNIWYGILFGPLILTGVWTAITRNNYAWEMKEEREWMNYCTQANGWH